MSSLPRRRSGVQPPVEFLNLVPTKATRQLSERLIYDAHKECGADSVLSNIADLDPKQTAALIGVLLDATNPRLKRGRPIIALTLSPQDRREAHRLYSQGEREPWVLHGEREYQRAHRRSLRARGGAA